MISSEEKDDSTSYNFANSYMVYNSREIFDNTLFKVNLNEGLKLERMFLWFCSAMTFILCNKTLFDLSFSYSIILL